MSNIVSFLVWSAGQAGRGDHSAGAWWGRGRGRGGGEAGGRHRAPALQVAHARTVSPAKRNVY